MRVLNSIKKWMVIVSFLSLVFAGCGGGGSGGGSDESSEDLQSVEESTVQVSRLAVRITGRVIDGPVAGATITLINPVDGELVTDENGEPITAQTDEETILIESIQPRVA